MAILFSCVIGALGIVVFEVTRSAVLAEVRADVAGRTASAAAVLESRPETSPDVVVTAIAADGVLVWLTDPAGRSLASAPDVGSRPVTGPGELPEGTVVERRVDGRPLFLAMRQVPMTSGTGYLVVARTPQPAYDALGQLRAVIIPSVAVAAVLTAAVAWLSVRRSLAPLTRLVTAAEAIARRSDHGDRIGDGADEIRGRTDEIGRLAATIDSMLASLERSHRAETAAHEAQRRFLADVSHELRAPLTIMQSSLDLAERIGPGDPGIVSEVLADMRDEVRRMSRRVTQLLVMARTGDSDSVHVPLLTGDLVAEVGARWQRTDPRVTYRCAVPPVDTAVSGDADQLRQVLEILLENASTYTGSDGSIDVVTTADDDTVTVAVTDNGVGISAEDLPRIFDRYHRGDAPSAKPGLGVGLSIAHQLVTAHGGTITATSEPGRGSTFTVRLPRAGAG